MTSLRKKFLAVTLAAAGLTAGFSAASGIRSARETDFNGGSRTAAVTTADYKLFKTCSLTLSEDGAAQVKENHLRFFADNKADVARAMTDANTWVSAPEPPQRYDYPAPPF